MQYSLNACMFGLSLSGQQVLLAMFHLTQKHVAKCTAANDAGREVYQPKAVLLTCPCHSVGIAHQCRCCADR